MVEHSLCNAVGANQVGHGEQDDEKTHSVRKLAIRGYLAGRICQPRCDSLDTFFHGVVVAVGISLVLSQNMPTITKLIIRLTPTSSV